MFGLDTRHLTSDVASALERLREILERAERGRELLLNIRRGRQQYAVRLD